MPALFSPDWMHELQEHWNNEPKVRGPLEELGFNAIIACGFKGENNPQGIFVIENGECVRADTFNGEALSWDMRASRKDWMKWVTKGIGLTGLGMAYTTGKLKFLEGDYSELIQNPKLGKAFVKSLGLMKNIDTD